MKKTLFGTMKKNDVANASKRKSKEPEQVEAKKVSKPRKSYTDQREKIESSIHASWNLLRCLTPSVGHFKFTDVLFLWIKGDRTGLDLEKSIHVVGVDLGSSHLGIVGLNAKRHVELFCVMDITKVAMAVTPIPISKTKSKVKSTEDQSAMDNGLKVVHQLLKHRLLNQLVRCDQWLLEQQMGTYFNPRTKTQVSGNVPARLVSMAIQATVLSFHQLTSEEPLKMSQVPAKSKYDQAPLLVPAAAQDPLREEKLTGSKNELKRKILGRNDAFHLMEYLGDKVAIEVLELVEQNLVPSSVVSGLNKKDTSGVQRIELDKIYDITDAYLIAQRLWYPSDVQKEKEQAKTLKKQVKSSKKVATLQEMVESESEHEEESETVDEEPVEEVLLSLDDDEEENEEESETNLDDDNEIPLNLDSEEVDDTDEEGDIIILEN